MTLSVCIVTFNEEQNIGRTLASVRELVRALGGEIVVVDSGSTDRTREIAESYGAKVSVEEWKGFTAQKNSAIEKARGDWILSLDADEEIDADLAECLRDGLSNFPLLQQSRVERRTDAAEPNTWEHSIRAHFQADPDRMNGVLIPRKNEFLGRWIKHGGFWPDEKMRLFRRGTAKFEDRLVHEDAKLETGDTGRVWYGALIHHAYPTLSSYIEHMNRYSSLGAEMTGPRGFNLINIWMRPNLTFFYNYFLRLGFLDGKEGFLLHLYHSYYVSWKYAKAWELSRKRTSG